MRIICNDVFKTKTSFLPVKYIFLSSSSKFRLGGHHYSIRDLVNTAPSTIECEVCQVGYGPNDDLAASVQNFKFFKTSFFSIFSIAKLICHLRKEYNKESVFIPFDFLTLGLTRLALMNKINRVVYCKPGGNNFLIRNRQVFPLIFFSEENFNYIAKNQPEFLKVSFLIKGRVAKIPLASEDERQMLTSISSKRKVFCVSRIDEEKRIIFEKGLSLFDHFFNKDEYDLFIIGQPRSDALLLDLNTMINKLDITNNVFILTDPDYYINVSRFFSECDFMISNGRTVIEALSLGKPCFVASLHTEYPILVTLNNIDFLSFYNLSQRSKPEKGFINETDEFLANLSEESFVSKQTDSFQIFQQYYSAEKSHEVLRTCAENVMHNVEKIRLQLVDIRMVIVGLTTNTFPWIFKYLR